MAENALDQGKRAESDCGQGQMAGVDTGKGSGVLVAQRGPGGGFRGVPVGIVPPRSAPSGGTSSINWLRHRLRNGSTMLIGRRPSFLGCRSTWRKQRVSTPRHQLD